MSGLEKIKERILEEARQNAEEKILQAKSEADSITKKAKDDALKEGKVVEEKSEAEILNYNDRIDSSIDLERRRKILAAKQEVIQDIIEGAKVSFDKLPDEEYFSMLIKLVKNHIQKKDGEMFLSDRDIKRMPGNFQKEISEIAEYVGGKLSISPNPKNIKNGCILVYGGIEENCTIDALFEERRNYLSDMVQKMLFD